MIISIMFHNGDKGKSLALSKLIADIEPNRRDDVLLALVSQPGTDLAGVRDAVNYCSSKMPSIAFTSGRQPLGANGTAELWCGAVDYFYANPCGHSSIFLVDGGDSVPLRATWIDDLIAEHTKTLADGRIITGCHSNKIIELSVWDILPALRSMTSIPGGAVPSWEYDYDDIITPHMFRTVAIYNEWNSRTGISVEGLRGRAARSAWSHGWKDTDLVDKARELILG